MDPERLEKRLERRLARVEKRLNYLLIGSAVQLGLLLILLAFSFLPSKSTLLFLVMSVVTLVIVFYRQIPGWFGRISRYVYAQILDSQKPDSIKDLK